MKIFLLAMAALFAVFTYFQFNDAIQFGTIRPLVVVWIITYGFTATTTFRAAIGQGLPKNFHLGFAIITLLCAIVRFFYIDWSHSVILCHETNPAANETGGLLILTIWHFIMAFKIAPEKISRQSD